MIEDDYGGTGTNPFTAACSSECGPIGTRQHPADLNDRNAGLVMEMGNDFVCHIRILTQVLSTPFVAEQRESPSRGDWGLMVLAEEHQLTKKAGEALLGDLVGLITKHLKKGQRIRIAGLGILQVRRRAARMGRNPATGEAIQIKASKKVAFRAAKDLKMAV
jgi:DNA-binding protein HU-beta